MLGHVIQIDEDIIEIYYYANIKEIQEDIIHELLKSYRSIS